MLLYNVTSEPSMGFATKNKALLVEVWESWPSLASSRRSSLSEVLRNFLVGLDEKSINPSPSQTNKIYNY